MASFKKTWNDVVTFATNLLHGVAGWVGAEDDVEQWVGVTDSKRQKQIEKVISAFRSVIEKFNLDYQEASKLYDTLTNRFPLVGSISKTKIIEMRKQARKKAQEYAKKLEYVTEAANAASNAIVNNINYDKPGTFKSKEKTESTLMPGHSYSQYEREAQNMASLIENKAGTM